jgi:membrane protein YqaA with SNARE-associated domain
VQLFGSLYQRALKWAAHRHAPVYLCGLSFAESSFFPVPPDVMLAPMALANRERAFKFAFLTTVFSVLGGMLGYVIGFFAIEAIEPFLMDWGYQNAYETASTWFKQWGIWVVFLAGFTPIPFKIFTISAGAAGMMILPFLLASFIGRGARFFLVAGVIYVGGAKMEQTLRKYIEYLGWGVIVLLVILYFIFGRH